MRNTPLWRPQPDLETESEIASEPATRAQRVSAIALVGVGLTLAVGIGAIGAFSFLGSEEPAQAAVVPAPAADPAYKPADQLTSLPEVAKRAPEIAPDGKFSAEPAVKVIEVAVAQSESDVAKLEEITGMVEPAPEGQSDGRVSVVVDPAPSAADLRSTVSPGDVALPDAQASADNSLSDSEIADPTTETASIQPDPVAPDPVAVGPTASEPAPAVSASPALPAMSPVKVNRYVNMRSGPADESRVIVVVPSGATVQAESNCGWCTVTYKGQRGYIYKSFLQRGGATASADTTAPAKAPSAKPGLY